jgi:hypothetical protein
MNIHNEFVEYGFDLDLPAIEKALENAPKFQRAMVEKLHLWSGDMQQI